MGSSKAKDYVDLDLPDTPSNLDVFRPYLLAVMSALLRSFNFTIIKEFNIDFASVLLTRAPSHFCMFTLVFCLTHGQPWSYMTSFTVASFWPYLIFGEFALDGKG